MIYFVTVIQNYVTNFTISSNGLLKSLYRTEIPRVIFREETMYTNIIIKALLFLFPEEVRKTLVGKHQNISL